MHACTYTNADTQAYMRTDINTYKNTYRHADRQTYECMIGNKKKNALETAPDRVQIPCWVSLASCVK